MTNDRACQGEACIFLPQVWSVEGSMEGYKPHQCLFFHTSIPSTLFYRARRYARIYAREVLAVHRVFLKNQKSSVEGMEVWKGRQGKGLGLPYFLPHFFSVWKGAKG